MRVVPVETVATRNRTRVHISYTHYRRVSIETMLQLTSAPLTAAAVVMADLFASLPSALCLAAARLALVVRYLGTRPSRAHPSP